MTEETYSVLIERYINNSLSEEEELQLLKWLEADPANLQIFKDHIDLNYNFRKGQKFDAAAAFAKIERALEGPKPAPGVQLKSFLKYAAVFIGILGIGFSFFYQEILVPKQSEEPNQITLQLNDGNVKVVEEGQNEIITNIQGKVLLKQEKNKLVYTQTEATEEPSVSFNTLNVPYGKKFELELTDNTRIILNAGSNLRFPTYFPEGEKRVVYLEGEAFFEVSEDATRPFEVHTEKMKIQVLGTSFNVSAYKNDARTTAVLASGKIAAIPADQEYGDTPSAILAPGQMASIGRGGIEVSEVNVEKYTAWTSGKLMFIYDKFEVIEKKLERHYDVNIINHCTELRSSTFKGNFEEVELEKVLKTFQIHTPFNYKIENKTLVISGCEEDK